MRTAKYYVISKSMLDECEFHRIKQGAFTSASTKGTIEDPTYILKVIGESNGQRELELEELEGRN